ncbi:hypothetical protein JCM15548_1358 [Geofilum rubicundum JCM 15548]|uniref:Uncharacterized protein n=1 Tax=Geofilum rubicundum JCM 15548 TaxID=1236989 RepID=A0A0E9LSL6_9BACT|nr:hypothetical protein JCM15548_1358 [Geofilum rubicundum JCM 15548]
MKKKLKSINLWHWKLLFPISDQVGLRPCLGLLVKELRGMVKKKTYGYIIVLTLNVYLAGALNRF